MSRLPILLGGVLLMACVLVGCGDGRPPRVPVSGQVLLDGKPLTKGFIRFYPKGGRPATAKLDADGRFTLSCYEEGDGVVLGTHPVSVLAAEEVEDGTLWLIPKKYSSPNTSDLKATISGPDDSIRFELTWAGGKPFVEPYGR